MYGCICSASSNAARSSDAHVVIGEQRHLANHLALAELRELELEPGLRILAPHADAAGENQHRVVAARALAHELRRGRKFERRHARLQLRALFGRQPGEQRDIRQ
jgi:hypothetical protein